MTCLNWSLKLQIRLRTISILVPHTSHMFMLNECLIHLCDCTCLNVFHMLNFCWSNTKIFFSVLIVFGKSFVFAKISKISKTVLPYSGDSVASQTSRMPPIASLHRSFCDSLAGQCFSREKDLENFQNSGFLKVHATKFGDLFVSGSSSHEVIQKFSQLPSRLPHGCTLE